MARQKRLRGRPVTRQLPPRVDATPEEMAKALFALPAGHKWQYEQDRNAVYRCSNCKREVSYPDTLYRDGRCEECHGNPVG